MKACKIYNTYCVHHARYLRKLRQKVTWCHEDKSIFSYQRLDGFVAIKVHLTPTEIFFRLNNSLPLFETNCAFLPSFSPNLDFLQALQVKKCGHHLFHDQASKGYGSIPGLIYLMSQTSLHACLQRLNAMQTHFVLSTQEQTHTPY